MCFVDWKSEEYAALITLLWSERQTLENIYNGVNKIFFARRNNYHSLENISFDNNNNDARTFSINLHLHTSVISYDRFCYQAHAMFNK